MELAASLFEWYRSGFQHDELRLDNCFGNSAILRASTMKRLIVCIYALCISTALAEEPPKPQPQQLPPLVRLGVSALQQVGTTLEILSTENEALKAKIAELEKRECK